MKIATTTATVVYAHVRVVCRADAVILEIPFLVFPAIAFGHVKPLFTVPIFLVRKAFGRILDTLDVAIFVIPFLIGITLRAMCHYGPVVCAPCDAFVVVIEPDVIVPIPTFARIATTFAWRGLAASATIINIAGTTTWTRGRLIAPTAPVVTVLSAETAKTIGVFQTFIGLLKGQKKRC